MSFACIEANRNMIIQHNLEASYTNNRVKVTTNSNAKSAEKLSSGYKINRAADDAAGLSISEKMRRQMRGLSRAVKNGQDGISFVQIADGALNEVHEMLQRGNELAIQAANGTLSESDRKDINNEIEALKEEIDSITSRTKFNERNIFVKGGISPAQIPPEHPQIFKTRVGELIDTIAYNLFPNAVEQIVKAFPSIGEWLKQDTALADPYPTKLILDKIDGPGGILAKMGGQFLVSSQIFIGGTHKMDVDEEDFPSASLSSKDWGLLESTIAHETMHGVMYIVHASGMYTKDGGPEDFPKWFVEGTAQLVGGGYTTGWNDIPMMYMQDLESEDDASMDSYISNYLKTDTVDNREYGHGYFAAAYASYLAASGNEVTTANLREGADKIFQKFIENEKNKENRESFSDVLYNVTGLTEEQLKGEINQGSTTSPIVGKYSAVEFIRRLTYNSIGGAGSLITESLNVGGANILGYSAKWDEQPLVIDQFKMNGKYSYEEEVKKKAYPTFSLHLGTDADMTNKMTVNQYDMSSKALLLENTNVLTTDNATNAINEFGDAIMMVSTVRSYFGAIQNRLEHTLKNLDNVIENTTASESRIRDTDMATEMVNYSKNNIIAQAGQSMLVQANQSKQGVMSLLG